jgi:hypothetical protein
MTDRGRIFCLQMISPLQIYMYMGAYLESGIIETVD